MTMRIVRECHECATGIAAAEAILSHGEATFASRKSAIETANQIHHHYPMNLGMHYDNTRRVYVLTNTTDDHYAEFIRPNYWP